MAFGDVIQTKSAIALTAVANISLTLDFTPIEGNMLIAVVGGRAVDTIDTPAGWTEGTTRAGSSLRYKEALKEAGAAEPTGIQFDWNSPTTDQMVLIVTEYEGPFDSTPLDQSANAQSSGAEEFVSSGTTGTTSQADELAVAGMVCRSKITGPTSWDQSFTLDDEELSGTGTNDAEASIGSKVLSATGTVESTCSWTTAVNATGGVITLKKQSGATIQLAGSGAAASAGFGALSGGDVQSVVLDGVNDYLEGGALAFLKYGVDPALVGPVNSTAETTGTQATTSDYQTIISAAGPGDTILLRAGTYTAALTVPAGSAGNPITIKPYNKEAVTVTGNWTPSSYNTFDGTFFDDPLPGSRLATVLLQNDSATVRTAIKYLYCDVQGGGTEAMRVAGNFTDVEIGYCYLDGGDKRHSFKSHHKVGGIASGFSPSFHLHHCDVTHLLRGNSSISEGDLAQFEGWKNAIVEYCNFHDEPHENAVDIKSPETTSATFDLRWNLFDHSTIATASILDHSDGPVADSNTRIYNNYIRGENGGSCVTLGGDAETDGYSDFQWNVIPDALGRIAFWNLTGAIFNHNYIGPADLQINVTAGSRPVSGLDVSFNRFDGTTLTDKSAGNTYSGTRNEKNSVVGGSDWDPVVAGVAQVTWFPPTSTLKIIAYVLANDYTASSAQDVLAQWDTVGNQRAFKCSIGTDGRPEMRVSRNGTEDTLFQPGAAPGFINGTPYLIEWLYDNDDGSSNRTVRTRWSADPTDTPVELISWTTIGTATVSGIGPIHRSTAPIRAGVDGQLGNDLAGRLFLLRGLEGANETEVLDPDFRDNDQGDWSDPPEFDDRQNEWHFRGDAFWEASRIIDLSGSGANVSAGKGTLGGVVVDLSGSGANAASGQGILTGVDAPIIITAAQVISSSELTVAAGLELLDSSDQLIEDISDALRFTGSSVRRSNLATIHGTCQLKVAKDVIWSNQRLRPYLTLTDVDGNSLRFDLGVFLPETPKRISGETPQTFDVAGYDKLIILHTPFGSSYEVPSGSGIITTVEALLAGESFSIDQTSVAKITPSVRVWPIDEQNTTLRIINDLLAAIGYRSLYVDRMGMFRSEPWISPSQRAPVYTYDTGSDVTILLEEMTEESDLFDIPNRWVFIRDDPAQNIPVEGDGIYTVANQTDGPTSINERTRTITRIVRLDAVDQASLVVRGDRIAEEDREPLFLLEFQSGPNPLHWHADTVSVTAAELGLTSISFAESSWELPLDGSPMYHVVRRV